MRQLRYYLFFCVLLVALFACNDHKENAGKVEVSDVAQVAAGEAKQDKTVVSPPPAPIADAATILSRKEVPVLCYHQIREYRPNDSKTARDYIVPPAVFSQQMKLLADSGYKTILPDELENYLLKGQSIPEKSVMLTFDDTDASQYEVAYPELTKYGFKGVFFIMTVSINRPRYMTRDQIRKLSDDGHVVGSHTWDHHNVKKYTEADWPIQVEKPRKQLEEITGKEVKYFAYPFGLWNEQAIPELKKRGITAAFQLSTRRDQHDPMFTIRRIIVPGSWSPNTMNGAMKRSFTNKL